MRQLPILRFENQKIFDLKFECVCRCINDGRVIAASYKKCVAAYNSLKLLDDIGLVIVPSSVYFVKLYT